MIARFDKMPFLEDDDAIGVYDGRKAVGDDEGRAALHQSVQSFLNERFGFGVEG